jgi:branched-chain amino acid transport system substrate-binding protein
MIKRFLVSILVRAILLACVIGGYFAFGNEAFLSQFELFEKSDFAADAFRLGLLTLVWIFSGSIVNTLLEFVVYDFIVAAAMGGSTPTVIRQFSRVVFYVTLSALIVHFVYGKSVMAFLTALGAGGVVIGLAAQRLIADVFNGLAINADRPFKIGDWIAVHVPDEGQVDGKVVAITWRTTVVRTATDCEWVIPNHDIGENPVKNHWRPDKYSWLRAEVVLDFETAPEKVFRILQTAGKSVLMKPGFDPDCDPHVLIWEVEDRGIRYALLVRFNAFGEAGSERTGRSVVIRAALDHLRNSGISPTFDKHDVYISPLPKRGLSTRNLEDVSLIVSKMAMFDLLSSEELDELIKRSHRLEYLSGHELIKQGDSGDSMFVVLEGLLSISITIPDEDSDPSSGKTKEIVVGHLGPGEFLGEMSLMTGDPRSASVHASTNGVCFEITKEGMTEVLENRPDLVEPISQVIADRRIQMMRASKSGAKVEETEGMASQLMGRMRNFFGLKGAK